MLDLLGFWDGSQVWSDGKAGKRHRGERTGDQAERVWAGLGFGLFYRDRAIHPFFVKRKIVISTPVCDHASEEPS